MHNSEELDRLKPVIEAEYLINGRSAKDVLQYLKDTYNCETTERKMKIKFKQWDWGKKIDFRAYAAMSRIMEEAGRDIEFNVPKNGRTTTGTVSGRAAEKEWQRKKANLARQDKPPPERLSMEAAYLILQESSITFQPAEGHVNRSAQVSRIRLPPRPVPYHDSDSDNTDDDENNNGTFDGKELQDSDVLAEVSRNLNHQNFPSRAADTHPRMTPGQQRIPGALIFEGAWLADLHNNMYPHTADYRLAEPVIDIVNPDEIYPDTVTHFSPDTNQPETVASQFTFFSLGPSSNNREKLIANALAQYYRDNDPHGHKKEALEFLSYYMTHILAGHDRLDDFNNVDRVEVRAKLRKSLDRRNPELLTCCYWIAQVISSHDKPRLLLGFLTDCIESIDASTSYLAAVMNPWIRFLVTANLSLFEVIEPESSRTTGAAIGQIAQFFDPSHELQQSIDTLNQHGDHGSATWLIISMYHAWSISRSDSLGGLQRLIQCLQIVEPTFGTKHLVTLDCMAMIARGREKLTELDFAETYLRTILLRLERCSRLLKPIRYRISSSLVRVLLARDELREARALAEAAYEFHLRKLGAQAPVTWETAELLFRTMEKQGQNREAEERRVELKIRYEAEWQGRPSQNFRQ